MEQGITLKDIARDLNVSITTVSKALNNHPDISNKRKKEILDYAKQNHYRPNEIARSFRKR
jgi:DNA-binding LacI/PurR family transcriptional regulator